MSLTDVELLGLCPFCKTSERDCTALGLCDKGEAEGERHEQIAEAMHSLERPDTAYLRWPWADLDALYGGIAPGTLHYVVGYSGMGKTTFIASALDRWGKAGVKIDVLPLELKANTFRTYTACQSLGIDPGLMLSGDFWQKVEHPKDMRKLVSDRILAQNQETNIRIRGTEYVDVEALSLAVEAAAQRGAQALVVDHIDHVDDGGTNTSDIAVSRAVNRAALRLAKDYDMPLILMSQANSEALSGNRDHLAKYATLRDNHVWMGGFKRQNATGMLSLYRPLKPLDPGDDVDAHSAQMARCRAGDDPPTLALWAGRAGIALMKSRNYGAREGGRIMLAVRHGYYDDLNAGERRDDESRRNGIATTSRGDV